MTETLRHRIGRCPGCRGYVWAFVDVESTLGKPSLDSEGRAMSDSHAVITGARIDHKCQREEQ